MSLGFEQAGFDVVAAVEIDPVHACVHRFNFPNWATISRDISKVSGDEIRNTACIGRRKVDVVVGGAPCQGFSLIGHRALEDPRNGLVREFVRVVWKLMQTISSLKTSRDSLSAGIEVFSTSLSQNSKTEGTRSECHGGC